MPRYFFNTIDGASVVDNEGVDLGGLAEARVEALCMGSAVLRDMSPKFWDEKQWAIVVTDEAGEKVLGLRLSVDPPTGRLLRELIR